MSLSNVVYKVISKMMASRLKLVLPKIISPFQSAFIFGIGIQDNSIIACERMHFLNSHKGKQHRVAIKIDVEKSFG